MTGRIFLDINLPNPATWFYFSGLLAVALFFKFTRFFSVRNLDVLALFLPMPGFLLLIEGTEKGFWGYLWLLGASLLLLGRLYRPRGRPARFSSPRAPAQGLARSRPITRCRSACGRNRERGPVLHE